MAHLIPSDEPEEHVAADYCECRPVPTVGEGGQIMWKHRHIGENSIDILDEAERIRMAESISLWEKAELRGQKLRIIPFASSAPIRFPGTSQRQ